MPSSETAILFIMRDDGQFTEPMNLMLLSALAKEGRPHRSTHLALIERDDIAGMVRELVRHSRQVVVAASAITGSHREFLGCFEGLKSEFGDRIFIIMGGPYCSTFPEAIKTNLCLDAIGVRECDEAWPEFLDALEVDPSRIHGIQNILTRENEGSRLALVRPKSTLSPYVGVTGSHIRNRFQTLDDLPYLDRALIYESTAFKGRFKRTHMASRGCPERCTYCFEAQWNDGYVGKGKLLVRYSPERFCAELQEVALRYDTRFWKFYDDVFPTFFPKDREWLEEFAEVYPRVVGLPFHCLTRADLVAKHPEVLELLKQAGIASITMSVESGNALIRDFIFLRNMTDEDIRFSFRRARELGIATFANTILGVPVPTLPTANDLDFDTKVDRIAQEVGYHKVRGSSKILEELRVLREMSGGSQDEVSRREAVVRYLERIGVRRHLLDYDRESVRYSTVTLGASYIEFPILHPFPATETTAYVLRNKWWDGDYDRLHGSYQNRSPFSCFTEEEKTETQNLSLLAGIVVLFSGSRWRVLNWVAIPLAHVCFKWVARVRGFWFTRLLQKPYTLIKQYIYESRIYPFPKSAADEWRFLREQLRLDRWKQFGAKGRGVYRSERPGATLGGPPSVP